MAPVAISRTFEWAVEENLQISKTFEWNVGDGPLYWWRIEWKTPAEEECGTTCEPCPKREIWHMMATSVSHLCERLSEDCNRQTLKLIKKVQKYDRPALCCDVSKFINSGISISDTYTDVDFCVCECYDYVDICDCPEISQCSVASSLTEIPMFDNGLFGMTTPLTQPGFAAEPLQVLIPKIEHVSTNCNCLLPTVLILNHNIENTSIFGPFLKRNNLKLQNDVELVYNQTNKKWSNTLRYEGVTEKYNLTTEWACSDELTPGQYGWRFQFHLRQTFPVIKNTRFMANFAAFNMLYEGISFNYNTLTDSIAVSNIATSQSRILHDELGLFGGNWNKDPYLKVSLRPKKEGKK